MSDLVKFTIPADFIEERLLPSANELAYGFSHGWLTGPDVVAITIRKLGAGIPLTAGEKALTLVSDIYDVPELVSRLGGLDESEENAAKLWLFLALDWLYTHRSDFQDPLQVVEMLYADFEYPPEMEGFVRFMPAPVGAAIGAAAIDDRWRAYLAETRRYYLARDTSRRSTPG